MSTNNYLTFCPNDTGTNLLTQSDYAAASDRTNGNQPGVASARLVNKAIRQSSFVTSQLAQMMADTLGLNVLDDGVTATLLAQLKATLLPKAPAIVTYASGSGTHNGCFLFTIASGSATIGAMYTNNAVTFTVVKTVASGTQLYASASGSPAVSGTLTKASGSGDATITFYAAQAPLYIRVRAVGGGGGGGGGGASSSNGGNGGDTTFGTTLIVAGGGALGGAAGGGTGSGGSATFGAGPTGVAIPGGGGVGTGTGAAMGGGTGGNSMFGGGGQGSVPGNSGGAGSTNSGGGGGGGASDTTTNGGGGGGGGGSVDCIISGATLTQTFSYAVGAGGSAGGPGTSGHAGGVGAAGIIEVTQFYQ